jgi:hypothetical protein
MKSHFHEGAQKRLHGLASGSMHDVFAEVVGQD